MIINFDFQNKFGRIFHFYTGDLVYEQKKTGKLFSLPTEMSEKELQDLQSKSVKDKVNYIEKLDIKEMELKSDFVY
ncbi:MAG: hypothetical protein SPE30_07855 [Candidatus Treponema excrementipullorum]|nr:hypothetical protein [Candidatus Treponema excrementipullorum]MDY4466184.1 hypothetical protein [Candidatus Treponema excrementipullorum]MDY4708402.1 hypothetical protein [Candidatus Treponema excrementipullorum]